MRLWSYLFIFNEPNQAVHLQEVVLQQIVTIQVGEGRVVIPAAHGRAFTGLFFVCGRGRIRRQRSPFIPIKERHVVVVEPISKKVSPSKSAHHVPSFIMTVSQTVRPPLSSVIMIGPLLTMSVTGL